MMVFRGTHSHFHTPPPPKRTPNAAQRMSLEHKNDINCMRECSPGNVDWEWDWDWQWEWEWESGCFVAMAHGMQ